MRLPPTTCARCGLEWRGALEVCDCDSSLEVLELVRVTTACEETARRPRPGRFTGEEVLVGIAAKAPEKPGNQRCTRGIDGDWPRQ